MTPVSRVWWRLVESSGLRPGYATEVVDDFPVELEPNRVYLVGGPVLPWSAALQCPCGCGAAIQLSLVRHDTPSWRPRRHFWGSVSLYPSIWRKAGCRSHFFVRRGRIVWSRSSALQPTLPPATSPVPFQTDHGDLAPMPYDNYPSHIERLTAGALSQMADYLSADIENPDDVAMLEDRAVGSAAKLVYFNSIVHQIRAIAAGEREPAAALAHLDALARKWTGKDSELAADSRGATVARAVAGRWRNWQFGAKERGGFIDHFNLPD